MSRPRSHLEAVCLALAGFTLWVLVDASLKFAGSSTLATAQITGLSGAATALVLLLYAAARGRVRQVWPAHPGRQVVRSLLDVGNLLCVVVALRHLPLALFYILIFLAPLCTALLAALWLRERLPWNRAVAILVGFAGVVLAVNPLGSRRPGDWTGYLACMVCVLCFSTSIVWSRVLTRTESPESLTFFSGVMTGAIGLALAAPSMHSVPAPVGLALLLSGVFGAAGSLCFYLALRHAPAATVSQFHYSQLVTGALVAFALWRERPTASMLACALLIVAAGLYTAASAHAEPVR